MGKANSPSTRTATDFLHGVPELLILRLLAEREMYGYEIVQGIRLRSGNAVQFGEGVIYPLLHSLQKRRLLAIRREKVNGRPRVYYRLTATGHRKLEERVSEWERVTSIVQALLNGESHEQPGMQ